MQVVQLQNGKWAWCEEEEQSPMQIKMGLRKKYRVCEKFVFDTKEEADAYAEFFALSSKLSQETREGIQPGSLIFG